MSRQPLLPGPGARRRCGMLLAALPLLLLPIGLTGCVCTEPGAFPCFFRAVRLDPFLDPDTKDCFLLGERFACPLCREVGENGSFEYESAGDPARWAGDSVRVVGDDQGVEPCSYAKMLRFEATQPFGPDASTSSEVYQIIDLRGEALPAPAVVRARVLVNRRADGSDTEFGLGIDAYSGDPELPFPSAGHERLGTRIERFDADGQPATWEQVVAVLTLPAGTDFLFVWTFANENGFNEATGQEFDGHYADGLRVMVGPLETYDLRLDLAASPVSAFSGDDVTFTVELSNSGPDAPPGGEVQVEVKPPAEFRYRSHGGDGRFDPATGRWAVAAPAVGERASLEVRTRIFYRDLTASLTTTGSAAVASEVPLDPDPGNNAVAVSVTASARLAENVALFKTVDRTFVSPGDTVVFTMAMRREEYGPVLGSFRNVEARDTLPPGLEYVDHRPQDAYDPATGIWNISGLAMPTLDTLVIRAVARATATNVVALTRPISGDVDAGDDRDSVIVVVAGGPCTVVSAGAVGSRFACADDAPYCRELLANAGFEAPVATGGLEPSAAGIWESSTPTAAVEPRQGITPCEGARMLQFVAGNTSFQNQIVNLTPEEQGLVATGKASVVARALFNRVAGDAETDTRFFIRIFAFPGSYPGSYTPGQPSLLAVNEVVDTDERASSWEEAYVEFDPPPNTGFLWVQVVATENVRNDTEPPEYDGHYADDVRVMLKPRSGGKGGNVSRASE